MNLSRETFKVSNKWILRNLCSKLIFINKATNLIMQEMESWYEEEQLGLSTRWEASDEVSIVAIRIVGILISL